MTATIAPAANANANAVGSRITPLALSRKLAESPDDLLLVDVRTPGEFAAVHVQGAVLRPLHELDPKRLADEAAGRPICLICHTGQRAEQARQRLAHQGLAQLAVVDGGTQACEAAGLPIVRGRGVIPLQRQAFLGASAVIWIGLLLGVFVSPWFLLIVAFAGLGLLLAGACDVCLMALILARMPWNRAAPAASPCEQGACPAN